MPQQTETPLASALRNHLNGSNQPPADAHGPAQAIQERLEREYAQMRDRFRDLEVGITQLPATVKDAVVAGTVTDFIGKQIGPLIREAKAAHKKEKADYLELGRVVDRFFNDPINRLDGLLKTIRTEMARYEAAIQAEAQRAQAEARRKAEAARVEAEKEAARHRAAAALYAPSDRGAARQAVADAETADRVAKEAQKVITAPAAKPNIRGEFGATGYLRGDWHFEVIDPFALPFKYLMPREDAIQQDIDEAVRTAKVSDKPLPNIEIPGVRIFVTNQFIAKG